MATVVGFYEWLMKQKGQRNAVGELARAAARDAEFPKEANFEQILSHYVAKKASAQTLAVARSAFRAYERSVGPAPRI